MFNLEQPSTQLPTRRDSAQLFAPASDPPPGQLQIFPNIIVPALLRLGDSDFVNPAPACKSPGSNRDTGCVSIGISINSFLLRAIASGRHSQMVPLGPDPRTKIIAPKYSSHSGRGHPYQVQRECGVSQRFARTAWCTDVFGNAFRQVHISLNNIQRAPKVIAK
jgi:hypothetical protein